MKLEKEATISNHETLAEIAKVPMGESFSYFRTRTGQIIDVRSPIEFEKGRIPGAKNLPLLSNEERSEIGICYKTQGKNAAIELGFDYVGPKLGDLVRRAKAIAPEKTVRIYCERGGMRSRSVSWLLETAGFNVLRLKDGYKSYRRWVRKITTLDRNLVLLNGFTGTGKTKILNELERQNQQVLDLEGLANHRGSSFGGLGMPHQPSTQQYENLIAEQLILTDPTKLLWIEAESGKIGNCWVPEELYRSMKSAPMLAILRPLAERLDILEEMYGGTDVEMLAKATNRIRKHLGGLRTKEAIDLILENRIREACTIILDYYDRSYSASRKRRLTEVPEIDVTGMSSKQAAAHLVKVAPAILRDLTKIPS